LNEVSPMKLYEYLAMGKPVVSTSFSDELLGLENILSIADSRSSFAQLVERALNGCGEDMVLNRKKLAGENSWQNRLNFLSDKIEACWRVKQKGQ
ncbi:MAG: hypothetical protein KKB22_07755, partial [Candidatus Omnitrophica bacterium]|nr:hypothetical protein [Candidatus Omnitrophota bacterium]